MLVLTIVHLYNYKEKIHLDNGAGVNRNNITTNYHSIPIHVFHLRGLNGLIVNDFCFLVRASGLLKLFKLTTHVFYKEQHFSFQPQVAKENLQFH